jgi:hypothetical protein
MPTTAAAEPQSAAPAEAPQRILNCIPSRDTEQDWKINHALAAGLTAAAPPPPAKDLRETWWTISDQGQTGSCVGWATADSLLRWHFVKSGRIAKTDRPSVRFIWMAAKETDEFVDRPTTFIEPEGTSLKASLEIARHYGEVLDDVLPFGSGKLFPGDGSDFYALASRLRIANYFNLGLDPNEWRRWIANNGPILTRLNVDATWMAAPKGRLTTYLPQTVQGGHAVSLVGYDESGFIVRNSWGTGWGDKGFAYATNAYAAAAFTESYGVSV